MFSHTPWSSGYDRDVDEMQLLHGLPLQRYRRSGTLRYKPRIIYTCRRTRL